MNTKVTIAGVTLNNPVMTASGTFGSGMEYGEFVDLNCLGAVVTKGVANVPWPGNPTPRVAEVYGGMLNAIGLQNPGIDAVIEKEVPNIAKIFQGPVIANVGGFSIDEYAENCRKLEDVEQIRHRLLCRLKKRSQNFHGFDLLPEKLCKAFCMIPF